MPDGNSRFKYTEQNRWGYPTKVTTTYSSNNVVALRSLTSAYATNDIDQISVRGPSNELLSSNAWNSLHQVVANFNAVNDLTIYTFDSSARLTSVRTPTGLTTTNQYYTSGTHVGWLQQTIDLEIGRTNGFGYSNGEVSAQTNSLGLVVAYTRDSMNRVIETHSLNLNITNVWDKLGLVSASNSGSTNQYCYDSLGRLTNSIDPRNYSTTLGLCGCGFILRITNAVGDVSMFDHDNLSQRTQAILPDNQTTLYWNYDLMGQVTNLTISGVTSITNYLNNQGLLTVSSNVLGPIESHQYDIFDRETNSVDVNGITIQTAYDLLGRVITKTYPDGGVEKYQYSAAGVIAYTNQLGLVTRYGYDAAGRVVAVTNANSEITRYAYDAEGNMTQLVDGKSQTNSFTFDVYGRLIRQTNASSILVLTNGYDVQGNVVKRWTPAKGVTTLSYDQSGNVTNVDYPISHDITFVYDGANQVSQMIDAVGTTTYTYDDDGQLIGEGGLWPYDTVSTTYTNGLRSSLSILQPNGGPIAYTYAYDTASRLSSIASPFGTFTYQYQGTDPSNNRGSLIQKLIFPNGSYVTNSFNNMGQMLSTYLKSSIHQVLNSHSYTYNLGAQRTRQTRTAGDYVDYTYDNIGQLKTAFGKESGGASRLQEKFGYAYDAAGNLQYRTNNGLTQAFGVDSLNQISSITRSGTATVAGNSSSGASSVTVNGSSATLYGDNSFAKDSLTLTNGANSYTAIGADALGRSSTNTVAANLPSTVSFVYDPNGNMLSDGNLGYDYDDANQLIRVRATNWMSEFVYDGKKRRRISRKYEKPGPITTAVTSVTPSATTFNGTGWDGMRFTVGSTPIVVTDLGRWKLSGNSGSHTLKLVDAGHVDVPGASVTVSLASGSAGQFIYATLAAPVVLAANTMYYLFSWETGEYYCAETSTITTTSSITVNGGDWIDGTGNYHDVGGVGYGPLSLKYQILTAQAETRFLYDGNLMIQERDGNNLPVTTYTRGPDLSGSSDGAGGIGGLVSRTDHTVRGGALAFYQQDGNGNVTCLINGNQALVAQYTYDPFGRIVASSGTQKAANRLQYSGKESDSVTGLVYYGRRFYNSLIQRWMNRDPRCLPGADGDSVFVGNDPVAGIDYLGMYKFRPVRYYRGLDQRAYLYGSVLAGANSGFDFEENDFSYTINERTLADGKVKVWISTSGETVIRPVMHLSNEGVYPNDKIGDITGTLVLDANSINVLRAHELLHVAAAKAYFDNVYGVWEKAMRDAPFWVGDYNVVMADALKYVADARDQFYRWGRNNYLLAKIAADNAADRGNVMNFTSVGDRTWLLLSASRMSTANIPAVTWTRGTSPIKLFWWGHPELLDENAEMDDHPFPELSPAPY